jgi:hypothetical protein
MGILRIGTKKMVAGEIDDIGDVSLSSSATTINHMAMCEEKNH